jgi:hypothetical protein
VIEHCCTRLKGFRGIATRYDKTATSGEGSGQRRLSAEATAGSVCGSFKAAGLAVPVVEGELVSSGVSIREFGGQGQCAHPGALQAKAFVESGGRAGQGEGVRGGLGQGSGAAGGGAVGTRSGSLRIPARELRAREGTDAARRAV